MNTETTVNDGGKVLYDAKCAFCTRWARRGERWLAGKGYQFEPLHRHLACATQPADEMKLITPTGNTLGGADAVVHLARRIWWAWPVWAVSRVPGVMKLFRIGYRQVAANRYCFNGRCHLL